MPGAFIEHVADILWDSARGADNVSQVAPGETVGGPTPPSRRDRCKVRQVRLLLVKRREGSPSGGEVRAVVQAASIVGAVVDREGKCRILRMLDHPTPNFLRRFGP